MTATIDVKIVTYAVKKEEPEEIKGWTGFEPYDIGAAL